MRMPGVAVAMALAAFAGGTHLVAQGAQPVRGQIVDASTRLPLVGVSVSYSAGDEAFSGADGRFSLRGAPAGATIRFALPGYAVGSVTVADSAMPPLAVELQPDTTMQRSIATLLDRLKQRRDKLGVPRTRVYDHAALMSFAGEDLRALSRRLNRVAPSCPASSLSGNPGAGGQVFNGGPDPSQTASPQRVRYLGPWIKDEGRTFVYDTDPVQDLYLVEVYPCLMVRLYSTSWIEQAASRGVKPMPLN